MTKITDERLSPANIIRRCIMDYVKRGGITEDNVEDVASSVVLCLGFFGYKIKDQIEERSELLASIAKMDGHLDTILSCNAEIARLCDLSKPLTESDKARIKG